MVDEHSEEKLCRFCRLGEEEGELYYPCKCSGSIKYIHEECLRRWLQHQGSTHCELCKHEFQFAPVYAADAPERLSYFELIQGIWGYVKEWSNVLLRVVYVMTLWLVLLPYLTFTAARMLFVGGTHGFFPQSFFSSIAYGLVLNIGGLLLLYIESVVENMLLSFHQLQMQPAQGGQDGEQHEEQNNENGDSGPQQQQQQQEQPPAVETGDASSSVDTLSPPHPHIETHPASPAGEHIPTTIRAGDTPTTAPSTRRQADTPTWGGSGDVDSSLGASMPAPSGLLPPSPTVGAQPPETHNGEAIDHGLAALSNSFTALVGRLRFYSLEAVEHQLWFDAEDTQNGGGQPAFLQNAAAPTPSTTPTRPEDEAASAAERPIDRLHTLTEQAGDTQPQPQPQPSEAPSPPSRSVSREDTQPPAVSAPEPPAPEPAASASAASASAASSSAAEEPAAGPPLPGAPSHYASPPFPVLRNPFTAWLWGTNEPSPNDDHPPSSPGDSGGVPPPSSTAIGQPGGAMGPDGVVGEVAEAAGGVGDVGDDGDEFDLEGEGDVLEDEVWNMVGLVGPCKKSLICMMMLMYSNLAATLLLLVIPYFVGQYTTMWGLQKLLEQAFIDEPEVRTATLFNPSLAKLEPTIFMRHWPDDSVLFRSNTTSSRRRPPASRIGVPVENVQVELWAVTRGDSGAAVPEGTPKPFYTSPTPPRWRGLFHTPAQPPHRAANDTLPSSGVPFPSPRKAGGRRVSSPQSSYVWCGTFSTESGYLDANMCPATQKPDTCTQLSLLASLQCPPPPASVLGRWAEKHGGDEYGEGRVTATSAAAGGMYGSPRSSHHGRRVALKVRSAVAGLWRRAMQAVMDAARIPDGSLLTIDATSAQPAADETPVPRPPHRVALLLNFDHQRVLSSTTANTAAASHTQGRGGDKKATTNRTTSKILSPSPTCPLPSPPSLNTGSQGVCMRPNPFVRRLPSLHKLARPEKRPILTTVGERQTASGSSGSGRREEESVLVAEGRLDEGEWDLRFGFRVILKEGDGHGVASSGSGDAARELRVLMEAPLPGESIRTDLVIYLVGALVSLTALFVGAVLVVWLAFLVALTPLAQTPTVQSFLQLLWYLLTEGGACMGHVWIDIKNTLIACAVSFGMPLHLGNLIIWAVCDVAFQVPHAVRAALVNRYLFFGTLLRVCLGYSYLCICTFIESCLVRILSDDALRTIQSGDFFLASIFVHRHLFSHAGGGNAIPILSGHLSTRSLFRVLLNLLAVHSIAIYVVFYLPPSLLRVTCPDLLPVRIFRWSSTPPSHTLSPDMDALSIPLVTPNTTATIPLHSMEPESSAGGLELESHLWFPIEFFSVHILLPGILRSLRASQHLAAWVAAALEWCLWLMGLGYLLKKNQPQPPDDQRPPDDPHQAADDSLSSTSGQSHPLPPLSLPTTEADTLRPSPAPPHMMFPSSRLAGPASQSASASAAASGSLSHAHSSRSSSFLGLGGHFFPHGGLRRIRTLRIELPRLPPLPPLPFAHTARQWRRLRIVLPAIPVVSTVARSLPPLRLLPGRVTHGMRPAYVYAVQLGMKGGELVWNTLSYTTTVLAPIGEGGLEWSRKVASWARAVGLHIWIRLQLLMFSVLFLAVAVVTNTFVLSVPLALGRYFFAPLSSELAHDFLPLCVGVTAAAALVLLVERSSTYLAAQLRETPRQVILGGLATILLIVVVLGVLPLMVGSLLNVLLVVPLRLPWYHSPSFLPLHCWGAGLVCLKCVVRLTQMGALQGLGTLTQRLEEVHTLYRSVGLFSLELHREVYRQLVGPALIELGLHLALPALLAKALTHSGRLLCLWELVSCRPLPFDWRAVSMMEGGGVWFWAACFLQRYCYHLALLGRMVVVGLPAAGRALDRLHHQLRDQKYLVAATLLNYTPTPEDQQQAAEHETAPETTAAPASPPTTAAASQHREWDSGLLGSVMRESLLGNL